MGNSGIMLAYGIYSKYLVKYELYTSCCFDFINRRHNKYL